MSEEMTLESSKCKDEDGKSSQNSSKENLKMPKTEKKAFVTSRLLQSTAASAARAAKPPPGSVPRNTTPVLARKFGSRGNTTPKGKPPVSSMGRPLMPRGSEIKSKLGQRATNSTKKPGLATSSFINQDKSASSPADWDASAIVPIDESTPLPLFDGQTKFTFDIKKIDKPINSSLENIHQRGPMKAMQSLGIKTLKAELAERTISRSLETPRVKPKMPATPTDCPADDASEDFDQLYDDFLLSELVQLHARKSYEENSDKMNAEVLSVWLGLEEFRSQVLEQEELNRKLDLAINMKQVVSEAEPFISGDKLSFENLVRLSESLEQSRHHLKIVGAEIGPNSGTLEQLRQKIESNMPTFQGTDRRVEKEALQNLAINLAELLDVNGQCREATEKVLNLHLEATSLKLSKSQISENRPQISTKIREFFKLSPKPTIKLLDL